MNTISYRRTNLQRTPLPLSFTKYSDVALPAMISAIKPTILCAQLKMLRLEKSETNNVII